MHVLDAVIGLGSNQGDGVAMFATAARELSKLAAITGQSALYRSPALGPPQPDYLNAAVRLRVEAEPTALLAALLRIEAGMGRVRRERWGPRVIDLDLLWIAGRCVAVPGLQVPHPALEERAFALAPLLDVAPDAVAPHGGRRYAALLAALPPSGLVRLSTPFPTMMSRI